MNCERFLNLERELLYENVKAQYSLKGKLCKKSYMRRAAYETTRWIVCPWSNSQTFVKTNIRALSKIPCMTTSDTLKNGMFMIDMNRRYTKATVTAQQQLLSASTSY